MFDTGTALPQVLAEAVTSEARQFAHRVFAELRLVVVDSRRRVKAIKRYKRLRRNLAKVTVLLLSRCRDDRVCRGLIW
jgi:hypothetical protein